MGSGASGMFETCMVAVLVSVMCSLIKEYGGFDALLNGIRRLFKGKKRRTARNGTFSWNNGYCYS